jgi:hypothetical protein
MMVRTMASSQSVAQRVVHYIVSFTKIIHNWAHNDAGELNVVDAGKRCRTPTRFFVDCGVNQNCPGRDCILYFLCFTSNNQPFKIKRHLAECTKK